MPTLRLVCCRPCRFRVAAVASLAPAEVISHAQVISDLGASLHGTAAPSLQHLTNLLSMWSEHTHLAHGAQAVTDLAHQAHDQPISSQLTSLYELADAATSAATPPTAAQAAQRSQDWLSPIAEGLEWVLQQFKFGLDKGHVPYSYGWSIVALTFFTKILTFPFTKAQVSTYTSQSCHIHSIQAAAARSGISGFRGWPGQGAPCKWRSMHLAKLAPWT